MSPFLSRFPLLFTSAAPPFRHARRPSGRPWPCLAPAPPWAGARPSCWGPVRALRHRSCPRRPRPTRWASCGGGRGSRPHRWRPCPWWRRWPPRRNLRACPRRSPPRWHCPPEVREPWRCLQRGPATAAVAAAGPPPAAAVVQAGTDPGRRAAGRRCRGQLEE